jgi:hypothetical protein
LQHKMRRSAANDNQSRRVLVFGRSLLVKPVKVIPRGVVQQSAIGQQRS